MKIIKRLFSKNSKITSKVERTLRPEEHNELVSLCKKALETKKLTVSKITAIFNWFELDFTRAIDPVASELYCHSCAVHDSGSVCLTQELLDCLGHIVATRDNPKAREIPESTNAFKPYQQIQIKYLNKDNEQSDRHIIFIKSAERAVKAKKTDITAICLESEYVLTFVMERIESFEVIK